MNLTCFKAYDIRGKLGEEINADIVYRIGRAYAVFLKPKSVNGFIYLSWSAIKRSFGNKNTENSGVPCPFPCIFNTFCFA